MYKTTKLYKQEELEALGFRISSHFSSDTETVCYYRFPVYKHGTDICFEAEFRINCATGECLVNVYDANSINQWAVYAAWYNRDYGRNEVVEIIDNNIRKEMRRFNIVEI